jgi:hypothetical protein
MSCLLKIEFKKELIYHTPLIDNIIYINNCNGIIMKICEDYFIFTCNHIIEKCPLSITCLIDDILLYPSIYKRIYEYDVCILKINDGDIIHIKKYYNIENIGYINCFLDCKNYISHDLERSCEIITNIHIKNNHIKSSIVPKIPIYEIEFDKSIDHCNISGSIVMNESNIFGMVICKLDKLYMAIPLLLIINFINNDLKYIKFNYDFVDFTLDKHYNGLYITDVINKKYNSSLNMSDVIIKCDTFPINEFGEIYCVELQYCVEIDTFIMLNNKNYVNITILNSKEQFENIICFKYNIDNICKIFIQKQNKYINIDGLVFTELSEELIIENIKNGINSHGDIFASLFNNEHDNKKYVILISNLNVKYKKYNKFLYMPILNIKNHEILNIDDIVKFIGINFHDINFLNFNKTVVKKKLKY